MSSIPFPNYLCRVKCNDEQVLVGENRVVRDWLSWDKLGIGFRNLKSFNLPLLPKQGWRLIQSPYHASYALYSIAQAMDVIRIGSRWRIGNRDSARAWQDKWIHQPHIVLSLHRKLFWKILMWMSLLTQILIAGVWDLIDQIFLPYETIRIKSIPMKLFGFK